MAEQNTFRSAFNGFNREDVVRYIEYLNAQHASEINRLNSELSFLRAQAEQPPVAPDTTEKDELIEQQAARIRELFDLNKAQEKRITALTANLDEALQQQICYKSRIEEELEAYRRAERIERMARERAEQMYNQANAVLADATVKVDDAAAVISQMSDKVMAELAELQSAVSNSKQALSDAAATMYAIRPGTEAQ